MANISNGKTNSATGVFVANPLLVGADGGAATMPATPSTVAINATVSPTTTSGTVAAASTADGRYVLLRNVGSITVYLGFGVKATTSMWPFAVGDVLQIATKLLITGITSSGTGSIAVLALEY